jgi:hypothetical protein
MNIEFQETQSEMVKPSGKKKRRILGVLILGGIPILFVLYLILGPILHILSRDISAKEMFVISEFVNVRATSDVNSLKMGKLDYGSQVLVYEIKDDWAEVLVDGKKVFISSDFIVDPSVYYTIEGIFGDERAAKQVNASKYRLALYRYFEENGLSSAVPDDIRKQHFTKEEQGEVYQIFSEPKGSSFGSVIYADFDGDFVQDAAFVLKSVNTEKKRLVIFSFDKKEPAKISKVIHVEDLSQPWMSIRLAKKGARFELDPDAKEKTRLPVNGILIGSNRSKDLKDPESLLLYNGQGFDLLELNKSQN